LHSVIACFVVSVPIWRGYLTQMAAVDVSITGARCRKQNPHPTNCKPSKQSSPGTISFGMGSTNNQSRR
jgi:hypothetical protein